MNRKQLSLVVMTLIVGLAVAVAPQVVWAQATGFQDAGAKIRGDIYWPGRATTRYV